MIVLKTCYKFMHSSFISITISFYPVEKIQLTYISKDENKNVHHNMNLLLKDDLRQNYRKSVNNGMLKSIS